jgi:DNA-binding PadR family transcriptional regulator
MLVLGVVHAQGRAHGYHVRRELLSWRADVWASVAPGSIYQALRTLTKHGLLDPVTTEAGSGGPERTVYELTPDGGTELLHLVRTALVEDGGDALNAAFAFLHLLARREMVDLLHHRVRGLRARLAEVEPPAEAPPQPDDGTPPQVAALMQRQAAVLRADMAWALDLAERVRDGEYRFADDGPD